MKEQFEVLFEPVRGYPWHGVPAEERFRWLLKASLRSYGLRAVEARGSAPNGTGGDREHAKEASR